MMSVVALQESFVKALPYMRKTARFSFPNLDAEKREEAVAAVIALAWKHWHRLGERNRADNPGILKSVLWFSIKQINAGRRIDSAAKPRCPMTLRAWGKASFEPEGLDGLVSKTAGVVDTVSFRLDIPRFLATLSERQRTMVYDLAVGMGTGEVAEKHGVTPGAVSQFRNRFKVLHERFFGE